MRSLVLAVVLVAAIAASASAESDDKSPWFCHGLDCPSFTVLNKTDEYEVREYKKGAWASTVVSSLVYEMGVTTGFKRLFDYISGENEESLAINMTAPVRVKIEAGQGPFCKSNFTVSFFVPFAYQDKPPKPSSPDVFLEVTPKFTAYVVEFGGFAVSPQIALKAKSLTETLKEKDVKVETDFYYSAGYDAPFKLTGRHNEVWVIKAEKEDHSQVVTA